MKLGQIREFFQGRTGRLTLAIFTLAFLLFVFFTWGILSQLFKKQPPPKPALTPRATVEPLGPPRKITGETRVEFIGKQITFPSQAPIFSYSQNVTLSKEEAKTIAQKLGFIQEPSPGNLLTWREPPDGLQIDLDERRLSFVRSPILDPELFKGPSPDVEGAGRKAREFMETGGLANFLDLDNPEVSYSKYIGNFFTPAEPSLANVITFTFRRKIDNTQVFASDAKTQLARVRVAPKNVIMRVEADLANYSYKTERVTVLPSFQESLDGISRGQGIVFEAVSTSEFPQEGIPLKEKSIIEISINEAKFAYFLSTKEKWVYPAGVFKGKGVTADRREETIIIIVPLASPD